MEYSQHLRARTANFHTRHLLFTIPLLAGVGEDRVRESAQGVIVSQLPGSDLDAGGAWGKSKLEWIRGQVLQHMSDDLERFSKAWCVKESGSARIAPPELHAGKFGHTVRVEHHGWMVRRRNICHDPLTI